jgi:hypothetical protein
MITCFTRRKGRDWDAHLDELTYAFNTAVHSTTKFTPYQLMFGRKPKIPLDMFDPSSKTESPLSATQYAQQIAAGLKYAYSMVKKNRDQRMDRAKTLHDRKIKTKPFQAGNLVWVLNEQAKKGKGPAFRPKRRGPFKVIQRLDIGVYRIQRFNMLTHKLEGEFKTLNREKLSKCHVRAEDRRLEKPYQACRAANTVQRSRNSVKRAKRILNTKPYQTDQKFPLELKRCVRMANKTHHT